MIQPSKPGPSDERLNQVVLALAESYRDSGRKPSRIETILEWVLRPADTMFFYWLQNRPGAFVLSQRSHSIGGNLLAIGVPQPTAGLYPYRIVLNNVRRQIVIATKGEFTPTPELPQAFDQLIRALREVNFAVANIIAAAASYHTSASGVTERLGELLGPVAIGIAEEDVVGSEHVGFTRVCTA